MSEFIGPVPSTEGKIIYLLKMRSGDILPCRGVEFYFNDLEELRHSIRSFNWAYLHSDGLYRKAGDTATEDCYLVILSEDLPREERNEWGEVAP